MAEHEHNACTRTKCMLILSEFPLKIINKYHCNQFPRGVENALDSRCHAAHSRVFALVLVLSVSDISYRHYDSKWRFLLYIWCAHRITHQ